MRESCWRHVNAYVLFVENYVEELAGVRGEDAEGTIDTARDERGGFRLGVGRAEGKIVNCGCMTD